MRNEGGDVWWEVMGLEVGEIRGGGGECSLEK